MAAARVDARRVYVSIHAPTRGATWILRLRARLAGVSIHAPTRGATLWLCLIVPVVAFQSTRPRGARRKFDLQMTHFRAVSIHAPTRGATALAIDAAPRKCSFQSTRPRGARPTVAGRPCWSGWRFNPRAHAGRDAYAQQYTWTDVWFQSTRPRGARQAHWESGAFKLAFQSTRPRGARRRL